MGGLILDNILVFLFRAIRLFYLDSQSRKWKVTEGTVEDSHAPELEIYPYASVNYSYKVEGETMVGRYERGFWYNSSAQDFASFYPASKTILVRYNPVNPGESFAPLESGYSDPLSKYD
jgi:hypothetical protein